MVSRRIHFIILPRTEVRLTSQPGVPQVLLLALFEHGRASFVIFKTPEISTKHDDVLKTAQSGLTVTSVSSHHTLKCIVSFFRFVYIHFA